jgi:ubiquitin carboxyl-terminal hydrolase 35/38
MDISLAIPAELDDSISGSTPIQQPALVAMVGGGQSNTGDDVAMLNAGTKSDGDGGGQSNSGDDVAMLITSTKSDGGPIPLQSLLAHFLRTERLDGANRYHCDGACAGLEDGERHVEIASAPPYLVLTLLRFGYDARTGRHLKIFTDIRHPLALEIPVQSFSDGPLTGTNVRCQKKYGLVAVVVHSGSSSDGGHYYCYARHGLQQSVSTAAAGSNADDPFSDRWFMFNDSRVSVASFESFHDLTRRFPRDTAYVLVYRCADIDVADDLSPVEPPLHGYLREVVNKDNLLFLEELENKRRSAVIPRSSTHRPPPPWYDDSDDGSPPPPGSCGGGMDNIFNNGPRPIF